MGVILSQKKGELVSYQGRKKAKTTNFIQITDKNGYIVGILPLTTGRHHDSFELIERFKIFVKSIKKTFSLPAEQIYLNADSAFDNKALRKVCFNHNIIPNIKYNPRNRKKVKRGRKRLFNQEVYNRRFSIERTFAWLDNFRTLIIRYERKSLFWFSFHLLAFSLFNIKLT